MWRFAEDRALAVRAADFRLHRFGSSKPQALARIDHRLTGWLVYSPTVGYPVHLLCMSPKGAAIQGIISSSPVTAVTDVHEFETKVAIYHWIDLDPETAWQEAPASELARRKNN